MSQSVKMPVKAPENTEKFWRIRASFPCIYSGFCYSTGVLNRVSDCVYLRLKTFSPNTQRDVEVIERLIDMLEGLPAQSAGGLLQKTLGRVEIAI
jgi:hypothetical protein